jgi:hypothetical protein
MRTRLLSGCFLAGFGAFPLWSGCAEQADDAAAQSNSATGATAGTGGSGGASAGSASAGTSALPKAGTTSVGGQSGGGGGGTATAGGTTTEAGAGGVPSDGGSGAAGGEGGAGLDGGCKTNPDCDDKNPCTTDTCLLQHCSYTSNTTACADDGDPCTADICAVGACTHPDNKTCACKVDTQCDDKNVCTDDHCTAAHQCEHTNNTAVCADDGMSCTMDVCAAGACTHKDNGGCGVGTPFTVDSFNSSADWLELKTSPDQRAILVTGINATNLEGNANLWIAEADTGTIEFGLASMLGLSRLRVVIRSTAANTGGMVFVGLWNGTAWSDKALSAYAAIPTGNYATIELPTADFGQQLANVTKLRLRFAVTGGEKTWQIDEIAAAK